MDLKINLFLHKKIIFILEDAFQSSISSTNNQIINLNASDPSYLKSQIIQNGLKQVDSTNDSSNSYKSDYMLNK